MPNRRFDWHEHIKDIEGEYRAARLAVDRLRDQVAVAPNLLGRDTGIRDVREADENLEGTYLVRLFAAFEAALAPTTVRGTMTRNAIRLRRS